MPDNLESTNDQMMSDFFSDSEGLIDQDTGADVIHPTNDQQQAPAQQKQSQQQSVQQPAQNAKNVQSQQQQQQQAPEQPKGFEQNFFKTDDKGASVFDVDSALDFFKPKSDSPRYDTPNYRQMSQQQVQQPQQPQEPEKPQWQKDYEELNNTRTTYVNNLTMYRNLLTEALQQGYQGNDAFRYADQKINDMVELEIRRIEYEKRGKAAEETAKRDREAEAMRQLQPRAETNLLKHYNDIGGKEKFEQLIFGSQINGKLVGGFGVDIVNQMFDEYYEYSGKEIPKDPQQLSKAYDEFWLKVCANPNRLQKIVDYAKAGLQSALLPHIIQRARSAKESQMQQQQRASVNQPSQIQTQSGGGELDDLDKYFGRSTPMQDAFDTV